MKRVCIFKVMLIGMTAVMFTGCSKQNEVDVTEEASVKVLEKMQFEEDNVQEENSEAATYESSSEEPETTKMTSEESVSNIFEQFLNDEVPITLYGKEMFFSQYSEENEIDHTDYIDADNDGMEELVLYSIYFCPMEILDVENDELVILCEGEGTAAYMFVATVDGEKWICHCDIFHGGRQMYNFKKYEGYGNVVDEFDLNAEYWENDIDAYDENSTFTYRDEAITMEEYEALVEKYTADIF